MPPHNDQRDDGEIIRRIQAGDPGGLEQLIERYGPKVKGYLVSRYGDVLNRIDINAAFNGAVARVCKYAKSFDSNRSESLRAWFMKIAQRQALNILQDQSKHSSATFSEETYAAPDCPDDDAEIDAGTKQRISDLDYVIENKLEGLQQAIIKADLKSSDVASAELLAKIHNTSTNSIYVSRKKARENIKKHLTELERLRESEGGGR